MSSQSGISVSPALLAQFEKFVNSSDRAAVLHINGEECVLEDTHGSSADFGTDLQKLGSALSSNDARYLIVRGAPVAGGKGDNEELAFVSYVPAIAKVSQKMKYASSANSIHRQLGGSSRFCTLLFWTEPAEVSQSGWDEHFAHQAADDPLTEEEQALRTAVEHEANRMGTRSSNVGLGGALGVKAKVEPSGKKALTDLKAETASKIALFEVDNTETVQLVQVTETSPHKLATHFKADKPRYAVYHDNGDYVFIYVCSDSAPVRDRMVYASTRHAFVNYIKEILPIAAMLEASDADEVHAEALAAKLGRDTASSTPAQTKSRFNRPKPPGRR